MISVAVMILVVIAFGALAIDFSLLFLTRTQLQTAADAAAHAGALTLARSGGDQGAATTSAIQIAAMNRAFTKAPGFTGNIIGPVVITADDVTFPAAHQVHVETHRTAAKGNGLRSGFLRVLDPVQKKVLDITAEATAAYASVCGGTCMMPWCPPDRWTDADGDGDYDAGEFYDPGLTGYRMPDDEGLQIVLKLARHNQDLASEWYYAVDFPPGNKGTPVPGGNRYRDWITGCVDSTLVVEVGDTLQIEPGNMKGPTAQGVALRIAADPGASWDGSTNSVVGSAFARSPRIVKACFFDPTVGVLAPGGGKGAGKGAPKGGSGRKDVVVAKVFAFFLEGVDADGNVTGRYLRTNDSGPVVDCAGGGDPSDFVHHVRLIE